MVERLSDREHRIWNAGFRAGWMIGILCGLGAALLIAIYHGA